MHIYRCTVLLSMLGACCLMVGSNVSNVAKADVVLDIDLAGFESKSAKGGVGNSVLFVTVGPNVDITAISWDDVFYNSFSPSSRDELAFSFSNSNGSSFWDFGITNVSGPGFVIDSAGSVPNMASATGGPFQLLADGLLRLEVFERVVDLGPNAEAQIVQGIFSVTAVGNTVGVPEPSGLGLLGAGFAVFGVWRRRRD